MNKRVMLFFAFYLASFALLIPLILPEKKLTVLPFKGERTFRIKPFIDFRDTTRGSLGQLSDTTDSVVVFNYTLDTVNHSTVITPISGFNIIFDKYAEGKFLNISEYDTLDLEISMKEAVSFTLYITTWDFFTDTTAWNTHRYTGQEVSLQPGTSSCSIAFRNMKAPTWWISMIGQDKFLKMSKPDYKKVTALNIQNCPGGPLHVPERMEIRKIEFRKDRAPLVHKVRTAFFLWIALVSVIILCIQFLPKVIREIRILVIGPTDEKLNDEEKTQFALIETFLTSSFRMPDLTQKMIGTRTHLPDHKISSLFRKTTHGSFSRYLNFLRMEEAKRLLLETDKGIAETGYEVGYNSIPHFNRVFLDMEGMSPRAFRERLKGKKQKEPKGNHQN